MAKIIDAPDVIVAANVVQFVPRANLDAGLNLAEFIRLAKDELTAFGGRDAWEETRWQEGSTVAVFSSWSETHNSYVYTPMAEPFLQFAKAYVRYRYSHKPVKSLAPMLVALRCVEAALLSVVGSVDIGMLNVAVMDVSAEKCDEFFSSEDGKCHVGRRLVAIYDFVRQYQIVPSLPPWKSPFKKPTNLTEDVGPLGVAHRNLKLPSNATMLLVADLFSGANDPESRYFSSILILLMATPNRISEVLRLSTDCIQWEPDDQGTPQMYLQWWAAKGKGPMKKWVVPVMHEAVQEAVRRLLEIGAPAREAARFAFDNPGCFMSHSSCLIDPNQAGERLLMPDEFCAAIGVKCHGTGQLLDGSPTWVSIVLGKELKALVERGATSYRDLAGYVQETYCGRFWPYIDEEQMVNSWDALCLHRHNEFHREFSLKPFSWRLPYSTEVTTRLTPDAGRSLFDRADLKNPDGSSVRITTHQFRHWLSTMSERAGMDEYTLAQWAGRARVSDNRFYDHRTPDERLKSAKEMLGIEPTQLLERFKNRQPVDYQELGVDRLGTAKSTLYGMCVHDYAMAPCQKQRECMTCKEHVCIKGDHVTLERIRLLEAQTKMLLERARQAHEDGDFGADRWVDNHKWKLAHVQAMRMALESSNVSDGSLLRIPEGHDPSAVRRALMDLGMIDPPREQAIVARVIPLKLVQV